MAATEVIGLVMDAMTNRQSALTSTPDLESRLPNAPEYVVLVEVAAIATQGGIFCCFGDALRVWSIAGGGAAQKPRGCAPKASSAALKCLRLISGIPLSYHGPCYAAWTALS